MFKYRVQHRVRTLEINSMYKHTRKTSTDYFRTRGSKMHVCVQTRELKGQWEHVALVRRVRCATSKTVQRRANVFLEFFQ